MTHLRIQNKNHESMNHRQNLESHTLNDDSDDTATENLGINLAVVFVAEVLGVITFPSIIPFSSCDCPRQ